MRPLYPCLLLLLAPGCYRQGDYAKAPEVVIQFAALPASVPADGATLTPLSATAPEAKSAGPGNASVQFAASQGRLIPDGAVPLDANGTASLQLQSPALPGVALIQATVSAGGNAYTITTTLAFVPALPESLSLTPQTLSVQGKLADTATLNIQAHRAVGKVTEGQGLTLTAVDATGAALGLFTNAHVYCDANGAATTSYSPGDTAYRGLVTLRATADGSAISGTATLQVVD